MFPFHLHLSTYTFVLFNSSYRLIDFYFQYFSIFFNIFQYFSSNKIYFSESIGERDGHGGHTDATTGQWQCGGGGTHCFAKISGWFCLEVEGEFFVCVALFIDLLTDQVQPLSRRTMKA